MLAGPVTRSTGRQPPVVVVVAVGEHRDRASTSGGIHLVDAEQRSRRRGSVGCGRPPCSRCAGLASASDRTPATWAGTTFISTDETSGALAAGYVETDPVDRHVALGDLSAWRHSVDDVAGQLGLRRCARSRTIDSSRLVRRSGSSAASAAVPARRRARGPRSISTPSNGRPGASSSAWPCTADGFAQRAAPARPRRRRRRRRAAPGTGSRAGAPAAPQPRDIDRGGSWRPV